MRITLTHEQTRKTLLKLIMIELLDQLMSETYKNHLYTDSESHYRLLKPTKKYNHWQGHIIIKLTTVIKLNFDNNRFNTIHKIQLKPEFM